MENENECVSYFIEHLDDIKDFIKRLSTSSIKFSKDHFKNFMQKSASPFKKNGNFWEFFLKQIRKHLSKWSTAQKNSSKIFQNKLEYSTS
jgi:hypothetical protein